MVVDSTGSFLLQRSSDFVYRNFSQIFVPDNFFKLHPVREKIEPPECILLNFWLMYIVSLKINNYLIKGRSGGGGGDSTVVFLFSPKTLKTTHTWNVFQPVVANNLSLCFFGTPITKKKIDIFNCFKKKLFITPTWLEYKLPEPKARFMAGILFLNYFLP